MFQIKWPRISARALPMLLTALLASGLLTACQTYDGFPTATPEPTVAPASTVAPKPTVRPTLPPAPTLPPRPTLPPAPASVQLQKSSIMKDGFNALLNSYFLKLASGDIYESGLRAMQKGLAQAGVQNPDVPIPDFGSQDDPNWNTFLQAFTITYDRYKNKVSEDFLVQAALGGAAASLQDCQTAYLPPSAAQNFYLQRTGQQNQPGIGVYLQSGTNSSGRYLHVIARVITGGPAEKAGLKLGDIITAVDGQDVSGKSYSEVIQLLQGKTQAESAIGTKLTLTIQRGAGSQPQNIELQRDRIPFQFMERQVLAGGIGYLRFNRFPLMAQQQLDTSSKTLDGWLKEFNQAGVKGLVIDLRGNQLGSIGLIQNFLSYFIDKPELVDLTGGRPDQSQSQARQYGTFPMPRYDTIQAITDKPLAVLVDGSTTAEAEIFAYAIQQSKRGQVVGDSTAGCLNASSPVLLKDNSLVNVTIYRVIADLAKPDSIVENVEPDLNAPLDLQLLVQGKDSQLEAAITTITR